MGTEAEHVGTNVVPGEYHEGDIRIKVTDQDGNPVVGARVEAQAEKSDDVVTSGEALTDANGVATFLVRTTQLGTNTVRVLNVEKEGCVWDGHPTELEWVAE